MGDRVGGLPRFGFRSGTLCRFAVGALDEVVADERATELLRDFRLHRYLQRAVRGEVDALISDDDAAQAAGT